MIKQTLFFSTPVYLSLANSQIVITCKASGEYVTRPIEDIGTVIIENQMVKITVPLLNELVKNNIAVILCDNKQMPTSMLMGLDTNTTQAESIKIQLNASEPTKKQAWKQIIERKIRNQSAVLTKFGSDGNVLKSLYSNVKSGDADNREGIAAKIYWTKLFGPEFKRYREGDPPNNLLNYGYSILRAAMARALLGSGLLPNLGICHRGRYNAFPLADYMMEPYRPYFEDIVFSLHKQGVYDLDKDAKYEILRLLTQDVKIGSVTRPLQIALTTTTASFVKYLSGGVKRISLPIIK